MVILANIIYHMSKKFIVGNWKSNKTKQEAIKWLQYLTSNIYNLSSDKKIVICPPFTLLSDVKSYIIDNKLPLRLGAQDISPFEEGSYTGEVNGIQIKEFADYVIIGHSERRQYLNEEDKTVNKKLEMVLKYGLTPILCISNVEQIQNSELIIQNSKTIIAFEPLSAVGTGLPDSPEHAKSILLTIKNKLNHALILYGGSVSPDNIKSFTNIRGFSGVLVGKESLDPSEFLKIIINA